MKKFQLVEKKRNGLKSLSLSDQMKYNQLTRQVCTSVTGISLSSCLISTAYTSEIRIWLCFTLLQMKFECRQFASIFVGVMPLLELKILEIYSFLHVCPICFNILSWNFVYDFLFMPLAWKVRRGHLVIGHPSVCLSVRQSVRPSVRLSVRPSICLSVILSRLQTKFNIWSLCVMIQ